MLELPVGQTHGTKLRYVIEGSHDGPFGQAETKVLERDWDVTDPEARVRIATAMLGPITKQNRSHAQWFVDPDRNAAALLVYRPNLFRRRLTNPRGPC